MVWGILATLVVTCALAVEAPAASLPDGRAYELVSPFSNKNGADVIADPQRTRAAVDGRAVSFASLTAFAGALGTGVATDYVSVRSDDPNPGTNGWSTHAITPRQDPLTFNAILNSDPLYEGDFSPDLRHGVFRAWSAVTDDPWVSATSNLYLRSDLLTGGAGMYSLVTGCPLCRLSGRPLPALPDSAPFSLVPAYAGGSADLSRLLFESRANLTSDAPAQPVDCDADPTACMSRAYVWHDGAVELAGLVPPSATDLSCGGAGPACVPAIASLPGQGTGTAGVPNRPVNDVSTDGSRLFFTVPTDSSGTPSAFSSAGRIYMRTSDGRSVLLSASERTDCAGDVTCGGDGTPDPAPGTYAPAMYWGASTDGARIFFTTQEALTDNAPVGGNRSLYVYDATKPPTDPHNLTLVNVANTDASNDVQGVMAVSDNGRFVYFISTGQLIDGEQRGIDRGIYGWNDGRLSYLGEMITDDTAEIFQTSTNYLLRSVQVRLTPDGRFMLFASHNGSGLAPRRDHGACQTSSGVGCRELYLYTADDNRVTCVSCDPAGRVPVTEATDDLRANASAALTPWHLNRAISDDGSRVFFATAEALMSSDVNGKLDVYEYDVAARALRLISSGTDASDSYFMDVSPDGKNVFIVTREQLVRWDTDTSYDLYDARVGGGFPDPPPPAPRCTGSACQSTDSGSAAPTPSIGSQTFGGQGDEAGKLHQRRVTIHCKRGFRQKTVHGKRRCVKRHKRRRAVRHHARRADRSKGGNA
jgi:hypothetical protein